MALIMEFLTHNFITLIILLSLTVTILVNRRLAVPATAYFAVGIFTLFLILAVDTLGFQLEQGNVLTFSPDRQYTLRIFLTAVSYVLHPLIIMILSFIVIPGKKYLFLFAIPAVLNAAVYLSTCFGDSAAEMIDSSSRWHTSIIGMSVYYTEIFYLFLLTLFSIIYFKRNELKRSVIVFFIVIQFILVNVLESFNILEGYTNAIMAMGMLEYYFYLSVIYQHEMRAALARKEFIITKNKLSLLRTQMHPHFIINALSIIRSLVKRDTPRAVESIDNFADYLKVHIQAIQTDEMIDFEQELRHVNAYLLLVQADRSRSIEMKYELETTDFCLPPLSLEPIIENAVKYGTGNDNGVISISTRKTENAVQILVADNGTGDPEQKQKPDSTGIGISNTRQRLAMQCGGTLTTQQTNEGMFVTITIPQEKKT